MPRVRDLEPEEYGLEVENEHHALIELPSGRTGSRQRSKNEGRRPPPSSNDAAKSSSGKWVLRWGILIFVLALVAVYHLGLEEGKAQVEKIPEDVEQTSHVHAGSTAESSESDESEVGEIEGDVGDDEQTGGTGSFTLEKLEATRKAGNELIDMLDEYYFGKETALKMLVESWIDPWDFESKNLTSKTKRADKIIDTMARALVSDEQTTFLMGAIGSSVVAGHDNCHYDSYESQMERLFGPVWEAAGMKFVFQNAGEGGSCGDSYANQIFCVQQNVSPNVDIVHYSWTYFEGGRAFPEHESLIRWTQMLPHQPPVHVFNTGYWNNEAHENDLLEHYAEYGYNALYMKTGFQNGGHDYESEKSREKDPFDRFSAGFVGDGYHNTTRYGELEADPERKTSLGVVMRNWHPGPLGFQLTSDAFGYVYTTAILKALDLIEKELKNGNDPRKIWPASDRPLLLKHDLPEPLYCDSVYCVVDEAPGCLNYEKPTFGNWGARVEDSDDDLNPHKGEIQNWEVWTQNNDLWHMVGRQDMAIFRDRDDKEMCRHLDACGGISASKAENGMVVFRLPKMEVGLVVICGCCGKDVAVAQFLENMNIEIRYNTVVLNRTTWDVFPNRKCVRLLKSFPTHGRESETPTGHAYLSIKVLNDMSQTVRISHVITL